mmetsp:Transcript_4847/g.10684  ORF Transcript_4847/g.10684 Transcript_4847/m.10684 type:complete len:91 (+) Transcript_4847:70-342(+)
MTVHTNFKSFRSVKSIIVSRFLDCNQSQVYLRLSYSVSSFLSRRRPALVVTSVPLSPPRRGSLIGKVDQHDGVATLASAPSPPSSIFPTH